MAHELIKANPDTLLCDDETEEENEVENLLPQHGNIVERWGCTPLMAEPISTPEKDSGIWALATAASIYRSWRGPALMMEDIPVFRRFVYEKISELPVSS